jgi:hypothetical protein
MGLEGSVPPFVELRLRPVRDFSDSLSIRRFVWKDLGTTKVMLVHFGSDAALLPQDFEVVGVASQKHPKAQHGMLVTLFVRRGS